MTPTLSTREVCQRAGITFRQADYWTREGLAFPDDPTPGRGYSRRWSEAEAEILTAMASLVRAGLEHSAARRLAEGGHVDGIVSALTPQLTSVAG